VSFCTHALRLSAIPVPLCMVGFEFMHQFEKVFLWKLWRYDLICGMFAHIRLLNRSLNLHFTVLQSPVMCVVKSAAFALSNLARDKQTQQSVFLSFSMISRCCSA